MRIGEAEMMRVGENRRLYGIQIVRAIACLGILAAHSLAYAEFNFDSLTAGSSLNIWGRYGLLYFTEIFFAMSGFFLSASIDRISEEYPGGTLAFLKNRAFRIYPIYWAAIVVSILLRLIVTGTYISNLNFFKIFFLLPLSDAPFALYIEWTLLIEIVFSIFTALFASPRRKRFYPVAMGVWGCVILGMLAAGKSDFGPVIEMPKIFVPGCGISAIFGTFIYYIYIYIYQRNMKKEHFLGLKAAL